MEFFKEFLLNPIQKKYVPVFVCLALGVMWTAIGHSVLGAVVWATAAALRVWLAGKPLKSHAYPALIFAAALFSSFAIYLTFAGAFLAAIVSAAITLLPVSILFTCPQEEQPHVQ